MLTLLLTTPTYERLCLFKDAAHAASVVLKRKLADRPAQLGLSRSSYIGLVCCIGLLARATAAGVRKAVGAWPRLGEWVDLAPCCVPFVELANCIATLHRSVIEQEQAKLDGDPEVPDDAKLDMSRKLLRRTRSWTLRARVAQLEEVVDEGGRPFDGDGSAASAIHEHWAKVFARLPTRNL